MRVWLYWEDAAEPNATYCLVRYDFQVDNPEKWISSYLFLRLVYDMLTIITRVQSVLPVIIKVRSMTGKHLFFLNSNITSLDKRIYLSLFNSGITQLLSVISPVSYIHLWKATAQLWRLYSSLSSLLYEIRCQAIHPIWTQHTLCVGLCTHEPVLQSRDRDLQLTYAETKNKHMLEQPD